MKLTLLFLNNRSIYFKLVKHNVVLWTGIVANIVTEKQTPTRNLIT